ncbi:DUF924 family protein [Flavimaricola marinus]|uniref:DUF924 domain-containing protein n=1 Tax=Flavimaricola marinus TaxID=1819565 RepID=A0A238LFR1_9RHOB|nr:DUF924 family protein [Flavimaricola marinus]SMY08471.1 hypothetical protein LOM8899_02623 [Flavimaricola marinus]
MTEPRFSADEVLDLWFPDNGHWKDAETHGAFWFERMQGGMDQIIIDQFADLTRAAARGELDHWAETPRGRLSLLIALDQFPRSLWRGTPGAYAQDIKACRLALEGVRNGDFEVLAPWEKTFFVIAISHCEGPDHLDRMRMITGLAEELIAQMPEPIDVMGAGFRAQNLRVTGIIQRFGRHPHRNEILGRLSTPEEEAYIAEGNFPHEQDKPPA